MEGRSKISITVGFLLLLAIVAGYLYLSNKSSFTQTPTTTPSTQNVTENEVMMDNSSANLSILPTTQTVSMGESFTLTVTADTANNKVAGMDLDIRFDPESVTVDSITKGSGIANFDQEIADTVDNDTGTIFYSAATLDLDNAAQGSSLELLTISATTKSTTESSTAFSFGPNTVVGDTQANGLHLNLTPATINFVE
jgi:hypothetical protein